MTPPVVVLADVNVDLTIELPDRDLPFHQRRVKEPSLSGGGTGGNTAMALARLGVPVDFHGVIGDDAFGRFLAAEFRDGGVGTSGLRVLPDAMTPQVIALLEPDGERYLVIWPTTGGAHTRMSPEHLDQSLLAGASWVHTTGMCLRHSPLRETILAGLEVAKRARVPTSLDLNLRVELWGLAEDVRATVQAAIALSDVVFGNGIEELLPMTGAESVESAVQLLSAGQRTVVARLGKAGVLACAPDGTIVHVPAFLCEPVNTVGAGDAFDGGFIAAMVEGRSLGDALRWGNAVAALKIQRSGGGRDLPARTDLDTLLAQHKTGAA